MQLLSSQPDPVETPIGQLYRCHWLGLLTAIRQRVSSQEDAEDILLDVFLAAMENSMLTQMSDQRQEAWLRRVAYNKCIDFHRRGTRRPAQPLNDDIEQLSDENTLTPERAILRQEELAQLQEHLASLSTAQQEVLRLRFADELPCAQIAVRMHKSEGAIRTMLSRTLNLLRGIYKQRREEGSRHE
ncbi:RNA polymerase, sigma-24 subunit, ECF subfamily [Ktedonobacter racemifer DSM 44963]|uniref:RNA polymerase, sigma-24 subunit, ECF subfamily n=2 Tax=Ktedonobacter racemifer TaxID=363277 RepID=D6TLI4_KTERA|nr:RNA polymerase, sigma-24 subunit, ECF subfamily [Ktedonobacter racemifer DSM 44963]